MTQRSGCLHADCITLMVSPDELDAMIESGGVAASISANSLILKSWRSGPFSWTKSASDNAFFIPSVNLRLSRDAFGESPMIVRSFQAASMYWCKFVSALGAGSVAVTLKPRAKYKDAQLAPITPVPTIAMLRISLFFAISFSLSSANVLIKYSSLETPICLRPPLWWRYRWLASQVLIRGDPRSTGNLAGQSRRSTPIAERQLSGDSMSPETADGRRPTRATQRIHLLELCRFATPQSPCPPRPCCPCQSS